MNRDRVILFCGHTWDDHDDESRWFSILAPEIPSAPSSSSGKGKKRNRVYTPIKSSLSPFSVMKLPKKTFFTAVGSCIYVFHDVGNRILMLSIFGDDSKLSPPMNHCRKSPHIITLDGKLYVIGGLTYESPPKYCFMECFDPNIGTWEPLPNPPFMIFSSSEIMTGFLEDRKLILVTSYSTRLSYTYNVDDRNWSKLKTAMPYLLEGHSFLSPDLDKFVRVGNMSYMVSFDHPDRPKQLVIRAFDLHLDRRFEGCLDVGREIFGEYDEVVDGYYPDGLIHLCHQKFCVLFQSSVSLDTEDGDYDRRRSAYFKPRRYASYLYSVLLEVSTILDKPVDLYGFMVLKIDVLSTEKYQLSSPLRIQDAMLVDNAFHPSNMLAFRCDESTRKEFGINSTPYGI